MALVEQQRAARLQDAQDKAAQLFDEIEKNLLRPGVGEKALSDEIHKLGTERHGVRTHWHKRVVRSGPNTMCAYSDNPPDRIIQPDDILIVDLGPVFEEWEADFGRTFVLGDDPRKKEIRDAIEPLWKTIKAKYKENPDMTGTELYKIAKETVEAHPGGWTFGGKLAGHIVGSFPHERIPKDKVALYITEGNDSSMNCVGKDGHKRHWILEVYIHDVQNQIGGFYEQLLTVG